VRVRRPVWGRVKVKARTRPKTKARVKVRRPVWVKVKGVGLKDLKTNDLTHWLKRHPYPNLSPSNVLGLRSLFRR
jgi:hypothetical protein